MILSEVEHYVNNIIPSIEKALVDESKKPSERLDLYNLYKDCLRIVAPYDFISYNKYLEFEEDKSQDLQGFYYHRKEHLEELFTALNDIEIYDKYDYLMISTPPRVGKSVSNIRFITWIMGRHPAHTQLAISYSDAITKSFYMGVMSILLTKEFGEVFPNSKLVGQNAKDENIWLNNVSQYPTISFIPIGGSMTGRGQGKDYIFYDDLVSGLEEAMSPTRLGKLWDLYSTNSRQRKLKGCKEIHIATRWSVHDVLTRLERVLGNNTRLKTIKLPCYDENGESRFDFFGGFDTAYYKDMEELMDSLSFSALYMCEPIEREGLLYHADDLQYYLQLPETKADAIVAICDSKNLGKDYVASLVLYVYGDYVYVDDVVYNNGLPEITRPLVANLWCKHKVVRADVELNNGGNYYAEDLNELIQNKGGKTSIRIFFSANNKNVKIISYSDFVKKYFIFKDKSLYTQNSEYAYFMRDVLAWTQTGKNKHDDAPDVLAMGAQLIGDLSSSSIKIIDRRTLGL